jgi:hypothetical protein
MATLVTDLGKSFSSCCFKTGAKAQAQASGSKQSAAIPSESVAVGMDDDQQDTAFSTYTLDNLFIAGGNREEDG